MLKYLSIIIVATLAIKANAQTNDNIQSEVAQNTSEQQGDKIALYMYQQALSVAANAHTTLHATHAHCPNTGRQRQLLQRHFQFGVTP